MLTGKGEYSEAEKIEINGRKGRKTAETVDKHRRRAQKAFNLHHQRLQEDVHDPVPPNAHLTKEVANDGKKLASKYQQVPNQLPTKKPAKLTPAIHNLTAGRRRTTKDFGAESR